MATLEERLKKLKEDIDSSKSLIIELKTSAKKEEEIFRDIIKEIKDLGFDPKTLKDDLVTMEKDIETKISNKEKEVLEVKATLQEIEKNVRTFEL